MQYVKDTGIDIFQYEQILTEADSEGKTDPTQDELYEYLNTALEDNTLSGKQAEAIWAAQGWDTSYEDFKEKIEKKAIRQAADTSGNGRLTQDELGTYLQTEIAAGRISEYRAEEIWNSQNWTKTFDEWSGTKQPNREVTDLETFKKYVPVYSDNAETAYTLYERVVMPLGISIKQYSDIIIAANADGKGTTTQDEMGSYLVSIIKDGKITPEQAAAIWYTIWNKQSSKTFQKWLQQNYSG